MVADDRRPYCDLRSAIRDHMETSLKFYATKLYESVLNLGKIP